MRILEWMFGPPLRAPAKGQVWRSGHSGRCIRITDVERSDTGVDFIYAAEYTPSEKGPGRMPFLYATGWSQWGYRLRNEARVLVEESEYRDDRQDATRFRELERRFAEMKFSASERVLHDLGIVDADPTESLSAIVDEVLRRKA